MQLPGLVSYVQVTLEGDRAHIAGWRGVGMIDINSDSMAVAKAIAELAHLLQRRGA